MIPKKNIDNKLLYVFLTVPLFSSIMSAIHLISLVSLGNQMIMSIALAITFELGSIVSFVAMGKNIMKKLKKELLYWVFGILFILQAFGNIYSSFDYIRRALIIDPTWLDSFREMFFNVLDVTTTKLTLAILIGLPIPIISLILLKAAVDYFSSEDDVIPAIITNETESEKDATKFEEPFIPKPMGYPLPNIELLEIANAEERNKLRNIVSAQTDQHDESVKEEVTPEQEVVCAEEQKAVPEYEVVPDPSSRHVDYIYENAQEIIITDEEARGPISSIEHDDPVVVPVIDTPTVHETSESVKLPEPEKKNLYGTREI